MEGRTKLKIGRKEVHDTGDPWTCLEIEGSEVKVARLLHTMTENELYLQNGKAYKLGIRMQYDDSHHWRAATSEVKGQDNTVTS